MNDHLQLRIAQSRMVIGKLSLRAMEDTGGFVKDASVRDKLTERFEEGTVVRLVPEDEYQALNRTDAADLRDAPTCMWSALPPDNKAAIRETFPRLAELASDGYVSAEAERDHLRRALDEACRFLTAAGYKLTPDSHPALWTQGAMEANRAALLAATEEEATA